MVSEESIARLVRSRRYKPLTSKQLADHFSVPSDEVPAFTGTLGRLQIQGKIVRLRNNRWDDPQRANMVVGRLHCNPNGFGFVMPAAETKDVYVADTDMGGALHNDTVLVEIRPPERRRRGPRRGRLGPAGRIVRVLSRANENLIGTFVPGKDAGRVTPDNPSIIRDIHIPAGREGGAVKGDKVVVKIEPAPEAASRDVETRGEVIRVLGRQGEPGVDVQSVIFEFGLPHEFPARVLSEAARIPAEPSQADRQKRRDFRAYTTVAVDPADARDRDDALSLYRESRSGHRIVLVHIADVSRYVHPDDPLDAEARQRGCSVYLIGDFVPMFPKDLTAGVLSLAEGKDRLAKTLILEFDDEADLLNFSVCHSVVNVDRAMTYEEVTDLLKAAEPGGDAAPGDPPRRQRPDVRKVIFELDELAVQLRAKRRVVGSLDLDVPEYDVQVDSDGRVSAVLQIERDRSHDLVEEFMLCANRAVAGFMRDNKLPCIYRTHDEPEEEALGEFAQFVASIAGREVNPLDRSALQDLLADVADTPQRDAINMQLLRSMKRALYSPRPGRHFALHFDTYCHFTSPVRRYPDLVVHQVLDQYFAGKLASDNVRGRWNELIGGIANTSSACEQRAVEAEREIVKIKLLRYFKERPDRWKDTFDAVITGVQQYGLFAQLQGYWLDGLIKIKSLLDDSYRLDERQKALIGVQKGRVFHLGQAIRVTIDNVDPERRQMDLLLAE